MAEQAVQIAGAVLILIAYGAAQRGAMNPQSRAYLWLNLAGSVTLTVLAAVESQYGFLLLEGAWVLITLWGLVQLSRPAPDAR
jgi:hypothetical protein